jgi:hypothetical protein
MSLWPVNVGEKAGIDCAPHPVPLLLLPRLRAPEAAVVHQFQPCAYCGLGAMNLERCPGCFNVLLPDSDWPLIIPASQDSGARRARACVLFSRASHLSCLLSGDRYVWYDLGPGLGILGATSCSQLLSEWPHGHPGTSSQTFWRRNAAGVVIPKAYIATLEADNGTGA